MPPQRQQSPSTRVARRPVFRGGRSRHPIRRCHSRLQCSTYRPPPKHRRTATSPPRAPCVVLPALLELQLCGRRAKRKESPAPHRQTLPPSGGGRCPQRWLIAYHASVAAGPRLSAQGLSMFHHTPAPKRSAVLKPAQRRCIRANRRHRFLLPLDSIEALGSGIPNVSIPSHCPPPRVLGS